MPSMDWGADWGTNTMEIINDVREEYGITNLNVSGSGFSKGGFAGVEIVAENIKQNPNIEPQMVFLVDDYSDVQYVPQRVFTEERMELFKQNNTVFFAFDPEWKQEGHGVERYEELTKQGLKIVRVVCDNGDHIQINKNFLQNGVYNYTSGGLLPNEGYTYQTYVYNEKTGQYEWITLDYETVSSIDNLYAFYGQNNIETTKTKEELLNLENLVLRSEDKVLEKHLNSIRTSIKSTSLLSSANMSGFGSTTKMPSQVPEVVDRFVNSTIDLLSKLASETEQFARIGESINEMNFNLERKVIEIEEFDFDEYVREDAIRKEKEEQNKEIKTTITSEVEETVENDATEEKNESSNKKNNHESTSSAPSKNHSSSNSNQTDNQPSTAPQINEPPQQEIEPSPALKEFPKYEMILSDKNKLVFEHESGYKLVLHKENDIITGVEHYYDLQTEVNAIEMYDKIKLTYQNNEYFKTAIQDGQYIKIIFKNEIYKNLSLNDINTLYSNLEGYSKI